MNTEVEPNSKSDTIPVCGPTGNLKDGSAWLMEEIKKARRENRAFLVFDNLIDAKEYLSCLK